MNVDFDMGDIVTTEFGIGRQKPTTFSFVPVDRSVQTELRSMVQRTLGQITSLPESDAYRAGSVRTGTRYYQPSEKYARDEYCYLSLQDSLAELFRDVALADNLDRDYHFPADLGSVTCYFVRLTDGQGRRLTAFRRAAYFKGILAKKLVRFIDDTLQLVDGQMFKLDADLDVVVDSSVVHVLRPSSFELLGGLKKAILDEVPKNVLEIKRTMPYVAFGSIRKYAETRIRAARYLTSIRQQNLEDIDRDALADQCVATGVKAKIVDGVITVREKDVMGFLEVLDRRRYRVELVREGPEFYRASSRTRVGGE